MTVKIKVTVKRVGTEVTCSSDSEIAVTVVTTVTALTVTVR